MTARVAYMIHLRKLNTGPILWGFFASFAGKPSAIVITSQFQGFLGIDSCQTFRQV